MSYRRSDKPPFSAWLSSERARHGLKAGEVAKRLREMGFPAEESTYRTWEAGRRPAPETVAALERLFGTASPSADAPDQGDVAAAIRDQIVVQQQLADAAVEANRIALEQLEATREQTRRSGRCSCSRCLRTRRRGRACCPW
jgi:transcriptional regulator with XRE-family HTH domain